MNLFKSFFFALLVSSTAFADTGFVNNANQTTVCSGQGIGCQGSTDAKGNLYVRITDGTNPLDDIPISNNTAFYGITTGSVGWARISTPTVTTGSTTTVIQITGIGSTARVGDIIQAATGTAANIGSWAYITAVSTNSVTVSKAFPSAPANTDTVYLARPTPLYASAGGSGINGSALKVNLDAATQDNSANSPIKLEDSPHGSGDAGMNILVYYRTSAQQSAGTTGDYSEPINDSDGRIYVNAYGAGTGEWFQSCSSQATGTADTAIKAAVASNRMYITSIDCANNSAVASQITFKDGATTIAVGGVGTLAATGGNYSIAFPVPLRGSVNTAFNFAMITTATATTCCAQGYISTN